MTRNKNSFSAYKYKVKNYLMMQYKWSRRHTELWVRDNENYLKTEFAQRIDPYALALKINNEVSSGESTSS